MDKRPEKMTRQDYLLDIQFKVAPQSRIVDIITIIAMMLIVYAFAISIYIVPDAEYSEQENRYLQQFPELTVKTLTGGQFTAQIADYFADQLPLRDVFVAMKGATEIAMLKQENNDVILAKDGYIFKRIDYPSKEMIAKNASGITAFAPAMEKLGIPYTVAFAGLPSDELSPYTPALYPTFHGEETWSYFTDLITADDYINFVDIRSMLTEQVKANSGNEATESQLIYKTDHHWTIFGAYMGYTEIMKSMGVEPKAYDYFTPELVSDSFYGTTWSSAGMKWVKPDSMYYLRYEGDDTDYTTTIVDNGTSFAGFYDRSYLDKKDKYSSYIGGNNARVDIVKTANREEGRQTMLLIKDSYAHSLASFLAIHYDLIILDMRYYKDSVIDLVQNENVDNVLVMYYLGSITDTNVLGMLNLGLNSFMSK